MGLFPQFRFSASVFRFDQTDRWCRTNSGNVRYARRSKGRRLRWKCCRSAMNDPAGGQQTVLCQRQGGNLHKEADTPLSHQYDPRRQMEHVENYGGGLLYDVMRLLTDLMSSHPRRYDLPTRYRLGVPGGQYGDYGGSWRIECGGLRARRPTSEAALCPAGHQIPLRPARQPLGDASGVRHGGLIRCALHSRAARDGTPKRRSTGSSPNRTTPCISGSTISPERRVENAVSTWRSSSTIPPILRPEGGAEFQMGGTRQCGVERIQAVGNLFPGRR